MLIGFEFGNLEVCRNGGLNGNSGIGGEWENVQIEGEKTHRESGRAARVFERSRLRVRARQDALARRSIEFQTAADRPGWGSAGKKMCNIHAYVRDGRYLLTSEAMANTRHIDNQPLSHTTCFIDGLPFMEKQLFTGLCSPSGFHPSPNFISPDS